MIKFNIVINIVMINYIHVYNVMNYLLKWKKLINVNKYKYKLIIVINIMINNNVFNVKMIFI